MDPDGLEGESAHDTKDIAKTAQNYTKTSNIGTHSNGGLSFGVSSVGIDINIPIYDSKAGWGGAPSFGVSTTLVGTGVKFYFDNGSRNTNNDTMLTVGGFEGSKYLSFASNVRNGSTRYEANFGPGIGIPYVNVSTSLSEFTNSLAHYVLEPSTKTIAKGIEKAVKYISK